MKYVTILACATAVAGFSILGPDTVASACSSLTNREEIRRCQVKLAKRNVIFSYYEDQVDDDDSFELEFKPLPSEGHEKESNVTPDDEWDDEGKNEVYWINEDENEIDWDYEDGNQVDWNDDMWNVEDEGNVEDERNAEHERNVEDEGNVEDEEKVEDEGNFNGDGKFEKEKTEDGIEEVFYSRDEKTGQLTKVTPDSMFDVIVSYNLAKSREDGFDEFKSEVEQLTSTIDNFGTSSDPDALLDNDRTTRRLQILGEMFEKLDAVDISRWLLRPEISKLKEDLWRVGIVIPILKIT